MKLGFLLPPALRALPFGEVARWAADSGFTAIDPPPDEPGVGALCSRLGLTAGCANIAARPLLSRDAGERRAELAAAQETIAWAAGEGVEALMTPHNRDPALSVEGNIERFQVAYAELAAAAEQRGVDLTLENWPNAGANLAYSPEMWDALFAAVPSPRLGLCFDPSHLVWLGIDYIQAARDYAGRILYTHAKDTELLPTERQRTGIYARQLNSRGPGDYGWWRYRLPGYGVINWGALFATLHEAGYDGCMVIEHEAKFWLRDEAITKRGLLLAQALLAPYFG